MKRLALLLLASSVAAAGSKPSLELISREVYLMGTRAQLATYALTREEGLATLNIALSALEQTEAELSTWRKSSAISTLNRQPVGQPWQAEPHLCRMFEEIWRWHKATGGAFDPGIGRLLAAWDVHGSGALPDSRKQAHARAASGLALFAFDRAGCTLTRRRDVTLDVGAFGKGEALDRAATQLGDAPWMVDLGGQVSAGGRTTTDGWDIAIAHPQHRHQPFLDVRLRHGSLSTSGGSERDLLVNDVRISHHFDPRSGQPSTFRGSVTVWHPRGLAADALSTALFVMGPEEGIQWADARGVAAVYLVPDGPEIRLKATRALKHAPGIIVTERE